MKIEVEAKLILTIPRPVKENSVDKILLEAEQEINCRQGFIMPETKTQVGIRIHIQKGKEVN